METSRRAEMKRKKRANMLINTLIGIVGLLIVITLVSLLNGNDEETANEENSTEQTDSTASEDGQEDAGQQDVESTDITDSEATDEDQQAEEEAAESTDEESDLEETDSASVDDAEDVEETEDQVTSSSSDDPIVDEVITNAAWKPVGTTQTGNHVSSYDTNSVDWAEKVQALSYASGLSQDNMYIKFIGNGGSPQKSIGTITSKDETEKYRIYLEWVDGQGWKPTKMEVLNKLP